MDCPKCLGKLRTKEIRVIASSKLKLLEGAGVKYELNLDQCFGCGGVWLDKGELDRYLSDNTDIIDSPSLGLQLDKQYADKLGSCPRCKVEMVRAAAPRVKKLTSKATDIVMDQCRQCQGIWLDPTEIDRLERLHKPTPGILTLLIRQLRNKLRSS